MSDTPPLKRQFVASVYVLNGEKVLLLFHKKLKKWLPPGGHLDPGELPHEAAIREAAEETGLKIELIPQENCQVNSWNAKSIPRPYLCLLEEIPPTPKDEAHQHVDFIYVGVPVEGSLTENERETEGLRYFSREELADLTPHVDIFAETLTVIEKILSTHTFAGTLP